MTATTPKFAIPYPTGTDRVADGDNAMQAIAERVEALLAPTPWTDLTLSSGVVNVAGYGTAQCIKLGSLVISKGLVSRSTPAPLAGHIIATFPAGFRPLTTIRWATQIATGGTPQVGTIQLDTNGAVSLDSFAAGSSILALSLAYVFITV